MLTGRAYVTAITEPSGFAQPVMKSEEMQEGRRALAEKRPRMDVSLSVELRSVVNRARVPS